ncbi:DUF2894 domain-containing protein [Hydrogenophaga atypica]|uniref:DUF2894 domain-containing protein n=1 Tax=Hydrogenophaga atypica TaxID=249409 RepID=A0ABW2QHW5_9BURK
MSDTQNSTPAAIGQRLQSLREAGAPARLPWRWHHAQSLQARLATLPPAVSVHLEAALERAVQACEHEMAAARPVAPTHSQSQGQALLRTLNDTLGQRRERDVRDAALAGEAIDPTELPSLRRFRASWSRYAAEDQVAQAIGRSPDNAGPLNSHALVLRSLALMRELSPDYLRRFMAQLDSLLWLDDLAQRPASAKVAKPAKPASPAKKPRSRS